MTSPSESRPLKVVNNYWRAFMDNTDWPLRIYMGLMLSLLLFTFGMMTYGYVIA